MSFCLSRCPPTRTKRNQVHPPPQRKHHATSLPTLSNTESSSGNSSTETAVSASNDAAGITSGLAERLGNERSSSTSKVPIPSFAHPPLHSFSFSDDEEDPFLKSIRPPSSPRIRTRISKKPIRIPSFALPTASTTLIPEEQERKLSKATYSAPEPPDEPTALSTSTHNKENNNNASTDTSMHSLLRQHVDSLFLQADNDQWTVKQFLKETQSRIQRPLTANEKQCVRKRLKELVNGRVKPQSESESIMKPATTTDQSSSIEGASKEVPESSSEKSSPVLDKEREEEYPPSMDSKTNSLDESLDKKHTIPVDSTEHREKQKSKKVDSQDESVNRRGPLKHVECNATDSTNDGEAGSGGLPPLHKEVNVEDNGVMKRKSNITCKNTETLLSREHHPATAASAEPLVTVAIEGVQTTDATGEKEKAPLLSGTITDDHQLLGDKMDSNSKQNMENGSSGTAVGTLRERIKTPLVAILDSNDENVSEKEVQNLECPDGNTSNEPENRLPNSAAPKTTEGLWMGDAEQRVAMKSGGNGSTNNIPIPPSVVDVDKENVPNLEAKPKRRTNAKRSKKVTTLTELAAAPSKEQPEALSNLPPLAPAAQCLNQEAKPSASRRRQHTKCTKEGEPKSAQNVVSENVETTRLPGPKSNHPMSTSVVVETLDKTAVMPNLDSKPKGGRLAPKPPEPPTQKTTTATTTNSRKRARKGSCALCLTCPCLKPLGGTDAEENFFNKNTFSRSEAAMEKAYLRRIQKLEKTCEHYEGQVEIVRRKLKQHRRDMWKRHGPDYQDTKGGQKKKPNYFLPDVKELEASASLHPDAIPPELVGMACRAIFPDTPCYQPTLTQFLGVRSKKSDTEGSDAENDVDEDPPEMDTDDLKDGAVDDGTGEHTEYVASPKGDATRDRVKRVEWRATVLSCDEDKKEAVAAPIWKSMVMFGEVSTDLEVSMNPSANINGNTTLERNLSQPAPSARNGGGIDELAGLFDEFPEASNDSCANQSPEISTCITVPPCPSGEATLESTTKVDLAMLSPRGRKEACDMIHTIEQDPQKLSLISRGCPEWKENMAFAMYQQDPVAIGQALDNVMEKRNALLDWQRRMMESFHAQKEALNVLEEGLKRSLGRLDQGGFLSQAVVMGEDDGEGEGDNDDKSMMEY